MENMGTFFNGLAALAWPIIVAILLFAFRGIIREVIQSARSRKFTIKLVGNEITMEEATEQQRSLISDLQEQIVTIQQTLKALQVTSIKDTTASTSANTMPKSILWVDDTPSNNAVFIANLSDQGIKVVVALSTNEALAKFRSSQFDGIITDMGRTEGGVYNRKAGLDLIQAVREIDKDIPITVYSKSEVVKQYSFDIKAAGKTEITSSPLVILNRLRSDINQQNS